MFVLGLTPDVTRYISEQGIDSLTCGETVDQPCRSLNQILEQLQRMPNPDVPQEVNGKLDTIWEKVWNQTRHFPFSDTSGKTFVISGNSQQSECFEAKINTTDLDHMCEQVANASDAIILEMLNLQKGCSQAAEYYEEKMNLGCMYSIWPSHYMEKIMNLMKFYMKEGIHTKNVNILTETNVSISGTVFNPKTNFSITLMCPNCVDAHIKIENTYLENTFLQINNTEVSLEVKNTTLFNSGIKIISEINSNPRHAMIKNCTFQGHGEISPLEVLETSNVFLVGNQFQEISRSKSTIFYCQSSEISILDTNFVNCSSVTFSIVYAQECNLTITGSRFERNRIDQMVLMTLQSSHFHVNSSYFTRNAAPEGIINVFANATGTIINSIFKMEEIEERCFYVIHANLTIQNTVFEGMTFSKTSVHNTLNSQTSVQVIETFQTTLLLCNITVSHNNARVLQTDNTNVNITYSTFHNNSVELILASWLKELIEGVEDGSGGGYDNFRTYFMSFKLGSVNIAYSIFTENRRAQLIDVSESDVDIQHSIFSHNNCIHGSGCGIHLSRACVVFLYNCTFQHNYASTVGAVLSHRSAPDVLVVFSHCLFDSNSATSGGAVFVTAITIKFIYCVMKNNSASNEGGVMSLSDSEVDIYHCNFSKNSAGSKGGVLSAEGSELFVGNCTANGNSAKGSGGIFWASDSTVVLKNSYIKSNMAVRNGGVIYLTLHSYLRITNVMLKNNSCGVDGGVINIRRHTTTILKDVSFLDNQAIGSEGGAIFLQDESHVLTENATFHHNSALVSGGAVMVTDHSSYDDLGSMFGGNIAPNKGGAIAVYDHSNFSATDTVFNDNEARSLATAGNMTKHLDCPPGKQNCLTTF